MNRKNLSWAVAIAGISVFAGACGGSDTPAAQDPSSVSAMDYDASAPDSSYSIGQSNSAMTGGSADNQPAGNRGGNSNGATPGMIRPTGTYTTQGPATPPSDQPAPNAGGAGQNSNGAIVANNPGPPDHTKDADNTKVNDRDRHGALTPISQGNSAPEIKITAAIRKGVMVDSLLSFTAKNVKIITVGTKVTLRGPVGTDRERTSIETIAKQTAGVTEVDNQIEVKK